MKNNRFKNPRQKASASKGEKELFDVVKRIFPIAEVYYDYPVNRLIEDLEHQIRFDVYIATFSTAIEWDGKQHLGSVAFGGTSEEEIQASLDRFKETQKLDKYKEKICEENEIKLIRISHKDWNDLKTFEDKVDFVMEKL